jgi:hypothetical protein
MAPHTTPYRLIISILFLSYTAIHINTISSPVVHAHTFQLARPLNTLHLSIMSYPADYGDAPPFMYANNDIDDEADCAGVGYNDSDDEADCGGVGYNRDRFDKKIPAKRDAPINLMRNMASTFFNRECTILFNRECTIPFNTAPRAEEIPFVNLLDCINPNPKIITK